jgi:hypothetical protein
MPRTLAMLNTSADLRAKMFPRSSFSFYVGDRCGIVSSVVLEFRSTPPWVALVPQGSGGVGVVWYDLPSGRT